MMDEESTNHLTTLADCIIPTHHRSLARTNKSMTALLCQVDSCDIDADAIQHSRLMMPLSLHPPTLNETTETEAPYPVQHARSIKDTDCIIRMHHRSLARTNKSMVDLLRQLDSCDINVSASQRSRLMLPPTMHPPTLNETTETEAPDPVQRKRKEAAKFQDTKKKST